MDYTNAPLAAGGDSQAIHGDGSLSMLSLEDFLAQDDSHTLSKVNATVGLSTQGCAVR